MPTDGRTDRSPWTVLKALQWTADYFKQKGLDTFRTDAETLLAHALHCQRIDLYLHHDQPLNEDERARFKELIQRRIRHEPVAYIVGAKEFWSLPLRVTPAVLIPRPDTECLVETALKHLPLGASVQGTDILELGVGSGAVLVALAHERPECRCLASDCSWPAIQLARDNARQNGVADKIHFFMGRWMAALRPWPGLFDMVLSNPPYIRSGDIGRLAPEIRLFEPVGALDGGPDGLAHITTIIAEAHRHLKPNGLLLLEIGFDQRDAVQALARQWDAYEPITFHKDYAGHARVAQLRKKGS
ncbi:MAG: peptide chain release factor N(5)-glutamine methyltransferase [Desulfatitalea sp.]